MLPQMDCQAAAQAARLMQEDRIISFPINPVRLARTAGIRICTYASFSQTAAISQGELMALSEDGFSTMVDTAPVIVYNPAVASKGRRRWTLLHEYCHIRLGHMQVCADPHISRYFPRQMESMTDYVTAYLIAPPPAAFLCAVADEKELARCFGLSGQAAAYCYEKYRRYLRDSTFPELGYEQVLPALQAFALGYRWKKERPVQAGGGRQLDVLQDQS